MTFVPFHPLPPRTRPRRFFKIEFTLTLLLSIFLVWVGLQINTINPGQIRHSQIVLAGVLPFALWIFIRYFLFGTAAERLPGWLQWFLLVGIALIAILK